MGKRITQTGRSKNSGTFVMLKSYMLDTEAWAYLTANARAAYIELKRLYNGSNNGELFVSWRDAARAIGAKTPRTAGKALDELIAKGFIRRRTKGSFSVKIKKATVWILTEERYNDEPATHDYRAWKPSEAEKKRRGQNSSPSWRKKSPKEGGQDVVIGENGVKILLRSLKLGVANEGIKSSTYSMPYQGGGDGTAQADQANDNPDAGGDVSGPSEAQAA